VFCDAGVVGRVAETRVGISGLIAGRDSWVDRF
jgi:hypothetical protein